MHRYRLAATLDGGGSPLKTLDVDDPCLEKEMDVGNSSNIITFEPFKKDKNRFRRVRYQPDPTLIHFDHIFGTDNWSRFLVLKTKTPISAAKLENILLSTYASRDMSFRPTKINEWLIETTTKEQSEKYQSLDKINGIEVSIEKHDKLNSI